MHGRDQDASMFRVIFRSLGVGPNSAGERVLLDGAVSGCEGHVTYLLLPGVANVLIGLEKGSDINCLSPPDMSVDSPVQGELQRTPVERSMKIEVSAGRTHSFTGNLRDSVDGHNEPNSLAILK